MITRMLCVLVVALLVLVFTQHQLITVMRFQLNLLTTPVNFH